MADDITEGIINKADNVAQGNRMSDRVEDIEPIVQCKCEYSEDTKRGQKTHYCTHFNADGSVNSTNENMQWYISYPSMFEETSHELKALFPDIEIKMLNDGRAYAQVNMVLKNRKWTFFLLFESYFPNYDKQYGLPIKLVLLFPDPNSLRTEMQTNILPFMAFDEEINSEYLYAQVIRDAAERSISSHSSLTMAPQISSALTEWIRNVTESMNDRRSLSDYLQKWKRLSEIEHLKVVNRKTPDIGMHAYQKHFDDADKKMLVLHRRCKQIIISNRAYNAIISETHDRIETETGGILLGHYDKGIWYVIEATDPGMSNMVFTSAYHEGDQEYLNHIFHVISRLYKYPLHVLGLWHRHPGSMDTFSHTDDITNAKYVDTVGNGCISGIINIDPTFRLTFYYVEATNEKIDYHKIETLIGDEYFKECGFNVIAKPNQINERKKSGGVINGSVSRERSFGFLRGIFDGGKGKRPR